MLIPISKNIEPSFIKILSLIWMWILIFFTSIIIGITFSLMYSNSIWFARFGSIATIAGLFLIMRPVFRKGIYAQDDSMVDEIIPVITIPGQGTFINFNEERVLDGHAAVIGTVFTVVGTIIWAFGDLIKIT